MDLQTVLLTPEWVSANATTAALAWALPRFEDPLCYPTRKRFMNPRAIDDLLGTILSEWYGTVAIWAAPGELSETTCARCRAGMVAAVIDHVAWPHDLVHALDSALEAAVEEISASLAEEELGCPASDLRCARELLVASLQGHVDDLLDVLTECVTGKLDRFVGLELERGLRELDRMPDTH